MTLTEQHLETYEKALLSMSVALAQQHSRYTVGSVEKGLRLARKKLADHIESHSHPQYEIISNGPQ